MRKAKESEYQYHIQEGGIDKKVKTFARVQAADAYAVAMSLANNDAGVGHPIVVRQYKRFAGRWRLNQTVEVRASIIH